MKEPGKTLVHACGLRKQYGRDEGLGRAVAGVDLDIPEGEMLAVMGPSGCGKSTLLHLLGGLDRVTCGELWLEGSRLGQMGERALASEPLVILADEPTGNLDSAATLDVLRLLERLRSAGQAFVIVTHDGRIAATADRLIVMRDGGFAGETRLAGGASHLGALIRLEG